MLSSTTSATTIHAGGTVNLGGFAQAINSVALTGGTLTKRIVERRGDLDRGHGQRRWRQHEPDGEQRRRRPSGSNSYTGVTTVNGGILRGAARRMHSAPASAVTVSTSGTVDLGEALPR